MLRFRGGSGLWGAMALLATAAGCGDSGNSTGDAASSSGGRGGTSGDGGQSSGDGASTSSNSAAGGSDSAAGGSGAGTNEGGSGGSVTCMAITTESFVAERSNSFLADTFLGGPEDEEILGLDVVAGVTGSFLLTTIAAIEDCGVTVPCLLVAQEDASDETVVTLFAASTGTLVLTASQPFNVTGSLTNVTLVEVTLDDDTSVTVVPGGKCLELASLNFDVQPPTSEWTCIAGTYDETGQGLPSPACDCTCGPDPDCTGNNPIVGCENGQTCQATGCVGTPTGWTCAANQYNGGPGTGCDCNCGLPDPDCELPLEPIINCPQANSTCNIWAACVPDTWVCNPNYYGDNSCDCGCGAPDADCADLTPASCEVCPEAGTCNNGLSPFGCNASLLEISENNALCL